MDMPRGSVSRNITVLAAKDKLAKCLSQLKQSHADWVVIQRPLSAWEQKQLPTNVPGLTSEDAAQFLLEIENYFYVLQRDELLEWLKDEGEDYQRSLMDFLNLDETDANDLIRTDGLEFRISQGPDSPGFDPRFAVDAAVVVDENLPVGVMTPSVRGSATRGAEPMRGAPTEPSDKSVDTLVTAEFPQVLPVGQIGQLEVTLSLDEESISGTSTRVTLMPGSEVVVRLSVSNNLEVIGNPVTRTKVPTEDDPRVLLYDVKAIAAGKAQINVRLFQPDRGADQLGCLKLQSVVSAATTDPVPVASGTAGATVRATAVTYAPSGCPQPDLVLFIEELLRRNSGVSIRFRITGGPNYPEPFEDQPCGERELKMPPNEYFQQRFARIEGKPFYTDEDAQVVDMSLRAEGRQLYQDLLSAEIRQELSARGHQIKSIQIKTDGHHIPWEMIVLPAMSLGAYQRPEEFLAERYEVTRWTEGYRAPGEIRLRQLLYVAPKYSDGRRLAHADSEAQYLSSLSILGVQIKEIAARTLPVYTAIDDEPFDALHFIGHAAQAVDGQNAGHSTLELETEVRTIDGTLRKIPHVLEPNDVTGKGDRWAKRQPLVFFNACQTGRQDVGLVRPGGWAKALLSSKAGAFVGTLWSVRDEAAPLFSQVFYNALLQDKKTFGQSALEARRAVAATKDPSWLAYVVYAHPNAHLVVETAKDLDNS